MIYTSIAGTGIGTAFQLVSIEIAIRLVRCEDDEQTDCEGLEGVKVQLEPRETDNWHEQHTCTSVEHLLCTLESPAMAHRWV